MFFTRSPGCFVDDNSSTYLQPTVEATEGETARKKSLVSRVVTICARITIKTWPKPDTRTPGMESLWQPGYFPIELSKFFDEIYLYFLSFHSCRCPRLSPRLLCHVTRHCKPWRNVGMRTSTCSARTRLLVFRWPGTKGKKMGGEMDRDGSNHQMR